MSERLPQFVRLLANLDARIARVDQLLPHLAQPDLAWEKPADERPAYVYVVSDRAGRIIYIGQTVAPWNRIGQHAKGALWWGEAFSFAFFGYASQQDALMVETELIARHRPAWNVAGVLAPSLREQRRELRAMENEEYERLRTQEAWAAHVVMVNAREPAETLDDQCYEIYRLGALLLRAAFP